MDNYNPHPLKDFPIEQFKAGDFTMEVHGCHEYDTTGSINEPVYMSATFRHLGFQRSTGFDYGRVANPTRFALEKQIALLEHGGRAWALSSGMATINLVFHLLNAGDHVLLGEDLYGGTVRLTQFYAKYGIEFEYVDTRDNDLVASKMRPSTKMLFIETPSNPMMFITDIRAMADIAHKNDALLVVDNTFLSPHLQKPFDLGADIVLHSGTKFLCGHHDVIAGFLIIKDEHGPLADEFELYVKSEGPNLSPLDAWLMLRSIKTLGIRMERSEANSMRLTKFLQTLPEVESVYYPGLPDHPGYALQKSQAKGFGSMISFRVKSEKIAENVLEHLQLIAFAESLGGVDTLLTYPLVQTHGEMPKELIEKTGLDKHILRLSVGIEDIEDIENDLRQALSRASK